MENRRSKDDNIFKRIWQVVEAEAGEVRTAKKEREERERGRETRREKEERKKKK